MQQLQSAFGMFGLLAIAWALSERRGAVSWRQAAIGLAVTFACATLFLKLPQVTVVFAGINQAVDAIADATRPAPPSCSAMWAAARCRSS